MSTFSYSYDRSKTGASKAPADSMQGACHALMSRLFDQTVAALKAEGCTDVRYDNNGTVEAWMEEYGGSALETNISFELKDYNLVAWGVSITKEDTQKEAPAEKFFDANVSISAMVKIVLADFKKKLDKFDC